VSEPAIDPEVARLRQRLERERQARLEAEAIGERTTRELWEHQRELDRLVEERTAQLEEARRIAGAATRDSADTLATVAHDLRTPLFAISASLDLAATGEPDDLAAHLDRARAAAAEATALLDSVLGTAGRPLADLVRDHEEEWVRVAARRGSLLTLHVEDKADRPSVADPAAADAAVRSWLSDRLMSGTGALTVLLSVDDQGDLVLREAS
jgi:signal transduction histidine kinase